MIVLASLTDPAQGIVETFGIDWPMLIAQAINFLIVAFVIWKFAFKNILSTIRERKNRSLILLVMPTKSSLSLRRPKNNNKKLSKKHLSRPKRLFRLLRSKLKRSLKNRRKMHANRRKKSSLKPNLQWSRRGNEFFARLVKKLLLWSY